MGNTLNSHEPSGIARHNRLMRLDLKTGSWNHAERDLARSFTTISFDLGATAGILYTLIAPGNIAFAPGGGTLNASAQGVCFGLVIANNSATAGTLSIWEGTASVRKFAVYLGNVDVHEYRRQENDPLFKWRPGRTLQARHNIGGRTNAVSINMAYWAEEP
jgi:hypothetical protein